MASELPQPQILGHLIFHRNLGTGSVVALVRHHKQVLLPALPHGVSTAALPSLLSNLTVRWHQSFHS